MKQFPGLGPLAHTYSIVAHDSATGQLGVAVQSHYFSVGSVVSWAEAGVGAVATQSLVNPAYGPEGLALLKGGSSPAEAVRILIEADASRELRQLAIVDGSGRVAVHTGSRCVAEAGHKSGDGYAVQANLMLNDTVWSAMAATFETSRGPLAERMLLTLEAAEAAGGDMRGKQSAALLVVSGQASGKVWQDRLIDLRVEDHPEPVQELGRLLHIFRAYEFVSRGDEALERNDVAAALAAFRTAEEMLPDEVEVSFWHAIALVNAGQLKEALPKFETLFAKDATWALLVQRLRRAELLTIAEQDLAAIVSLAR